MHGTQERKTRKAKNGVKIPPSFRVKRCRHACNNCHRTFVADSQEAFCRSCGSNALTVTYIL